MGALNSIPLCSKASNRSPVLELDEEEDNKVPGSDSNNNNSTVVTQPIRSSEIPEATSTPSESLESSSASEHGDEEENKEDSLPPTLDTVLPESTNDSGLDDLEDEEASIPNPPSEDEGEKSSDDSEPERPLSPTPPPLNDVLGVENGKTSDKGFSNLLDDILTSSDSTNVIQPLR